MASQRKASRSQTGSTAYGVLAGLLIGLTIAAAVAFYVTRAPMPFVDRASRQHEQQKMPDLSKVNPNQGLTGGTVTVPPAAPAPGAEEDADKGKTDDLGALIASLPADDKKLAAAEGAPAAPAPAPAPAAKPASAAPKAAAAPAAANATYFLQAGAYRQSADADAARARILLLGMKAVVQRAEVNGTQWYRVRVGPFAKLDDMNRARVALADKKISSTIVRQ